MTELLGRMYSWIAFIPNITVINILEILLISFLIYEVLVWVQNTRAWSLLKGGAFIFGFYLLASILHFTTITWIISHAGQLALIALLIIFQPELRKALEQLGNKNIITEFFSSDDLHITEGYTEKTVNEIVRAAYEMGKVKTGALIVIERETSLQEIERTGIDVDGLVSSQLLINIFEHNTPLHDGAVILRDNRVVSATCYLPLSDNLELSKDLGTRHRASIGVSEVSDSLTIVVSEETGVVSVAAEGKLTRHVDAEAMTELLRRVSRKSSDSSRRRWWRGKKHEK